MLVDPEAEIQAIEGAVRRAVEGLEGLLGSDMRPSIQRDVARAVLEARSLHNKVRFIVGYLYMQAHG
jgi:hypothetical protein